MAVKAKGRVTFVKNIPGDAAISVDMTPRQVVLNTNNSGVVEDFSGAVATVTAYRGSEPISPTNITIRRVQNCVARVDMTTRTVKITQVSQNGDTGYSHEYGSVDIDVRVGTQTFTQKLTFIVNIHKVVARMKQEQDRVLLSVTELKKSEGAMKEVISSISTNVEEIQLEVASREYGGTNLLYGTSFNELPPPLTSFRLDSAVNNATLGMDDSKKHLGRNYLRIEQRGATEAKFSGLFHCVAVEPGGIYTASVWIMSDDIASIDNKGFAIEVVKMKGGERVSGNAVLGYQYTKPKIANQWERLKFTFTVPDDINQIGVNFWLSQNGRICISEPQLERGNVLTDWSENPNDVKNSLESAGIKIRKDSIVMRGKNVVIEDEYGDSETLFQGGKMRGKFIDIEQLFTEEMDARHAIIKNLTVTGFVRQRAFHVTQENFYNVAIPKEYKGKISYEVDFTKTGAFIVFDFLPANRTCIIFPSITYNYGRFLSKADIPRMIPFLEQSGQRVFVINNAGTNELHLAGCFNGYGMSIDVDDSNAWNNRNNEYAYYKDRYLLVGSVAGLECTWRATGDGANGPGDICVYWDFTLCLPG